MKLHSELTARTILRRQPRTHDHRFIHPVLAHLSAPSSLNNRTTTNAVGRIRELLMTEQTHSAHARPRSMPRSLHLPAPYGPGTWQLYDLSSDPGEVHDQSAARPDKLADLLELWDRYVEENGVIIGPVSLFEVDVEA